VPGAGACARFDHHLLFTPFFSINPIHASTSSHHSSAHFRP